MSDDALLMILQARIINEFRYTLRITLSPLLIGCNFNGKIVDMSLKGLVLELNQQKVFVPKVVGDFNAHNLLMVYAVACLSM